jgi:flagellar biosynthesis protein FlhG
MNQPIPDQAEKLRQLVAQESSDPPNSGAQGAVLEPPVSTSDSENEIFTPTSTDEIPKIDPNPKIDAPVKPRAKTTDASPKHDTNKQDVKQKDAGHEAKSVKTAQPSKSNTSGTIVIETPKSAQKPINDLATKNINKQRSSEKIRKKNKNGSATPQKTIQSKDLLKATQPLNTPDAKTKNEAPPKLKTAPLKPEAKTASPVARKTIVPAEKVRAKIAKPAVKDNSSVVTSLMETHRFPMNNNTQVIAITGGKGGVGKSNIACNLAIAMSQMGKKVMVLDADLSLANVDVLLGLTPRLNLSHVISGEKSMSDITIKGPAGIHIIPGGSGVEELSQLNVQEMNRLFDAFGNLTPPPDILLIDTAAGIHPNVMQFLSAADKIIVVTTPEPTAYTDAYALIKTLLKHGDDREIGLLINMAQNAREASEVLRLMLQMCRQFLDLSFNNIGFVPRDPEVLKAVRYQKPFLLRTPNSPASQTIRNIAATILQIEVSNSNKRGLKRFFSRLFKQAPPKEKAAS